MSALFVSCVCTGTYRGQKRASESLELDACEAPDASARNCSWVFWRCPLLLSHLLSPEKVNSQVDKILWKESRLAAADAWVQGHLTGLHECVGGGR